MEVVTGDADIDVKIRQWLDWDKVSDNWWELDKIKMRGLCLKQFSLHRSWTIKLIINNNNNNNVSYIALNPIWEIAQRASQYNIKIPTKRFDKQVCFQPLIKYINIIQY